MINDVASVEDLVRELQSASHIASNDVQEGKVLFQGKVLDRKALLRQAGVKDGSNLIVVTDNYQMKGKEVLALFLEMMSNEEHWKIYKRKWRSSSKDFYSNFWREAQYLKRQDVSNFLKNSLDISYHRLRAIWDFPFFRSALTDPIRIEVYRKVVEKHLSKKILADIPGAKKLVESPDLWRREILKATSALIRVGDIILDGVLDILLDVLKGAGKRPNATPGTVMGNQCDVDNWEDDPSLANNLLFELSESEDEN